MSLIGRHDNAFTNLRRAAVIGRRNGAIGYLNSDWGDGGHPQPLAVSYAPFLVGAAVSWCADSYDESLLAPVLNRDVFQDRAGLIAQAALALGIAHRKFKYTAPNVTPFGATIAAPPPRLRELFCRDGLKYFARIAGKNVKSALEEVETQRAILSRSRPATPSAGVLGFELDLAARMAAESCRFMLWQQAVAAGNHSKARDLAHRGVARLRDLEKRYYEYWPTRNRGTPKKYWPFLKWRLRDYQRGTLPIPQHIAAVERRSTSAD